MELTIKDVLNACDGKLIWGEETMFCETFSHDTRTIQAGDVYIGIKGENFDGNKFYEQALEKGAKVCILQDVFFAEEIKEKYADRAIILVEDTIKALQQIATYKRSLYDIPVIAITGSVGKTSTKDMVASVVGTSYRVLKTQGNLNNHIGVPMTILGLKDQEALVVEMGMNHLGEISVLSKIAMPTIAIITNVGTAHIGNLGSRENILKAKLEILEGLSSRGVLIVNNDNDLLHHWKESQKGRNIVTYGEENLSDWMACDVVLQQQESKFTLVENGEKMKITVPVPGNHFVYNALCAIAVGKILRIPMEKIKEGIEHFELSQNRMEILQKGDVTIVNDSYNANFDSMKAAIESIAKMKGKRKIAVLGDMLELGDFSEVLHYQVGMEVAKNKIDILVTVGNEAQNIVRGALEEGVLPSQVHLFENNLQAISYLKKELKKQDVVLIKASNGMKFIEIVDSLK